MKPGAAEYRSFANELAASAAGSWQLPPSGFGTQRSGRSDRPDAGNETLNLALEDIRLLLALVVSVAQLLLDQPPAFDPGRS